MATAAIMVAHQVAARAFRDAAFLAAWPAAALPLMTSPFVAYGMACEADQIVRTASESRVPLGLRRRGNDAVILISAGNLADADCRPES
jgi:hypothetical protein